jgi:hypothetical protein
MDLQTRLHQRLQEGLEQGISLVIAKTVIAQLDVGIDPAEPFRMGLEFGSRYRRSGWGSGLTIHTCMLHLLPYLEESDRPQALFHGLAAVARDCAGNPPRFEVSPLPFICRWGHAKTLVSAVCRGTRYSRGGTLFGQTYQIARRLHRGEHLFE